MIEYAVCRWIYKAPENFSRYILENLGIIIPQQCFILIFWNKYIVVPKFEL